MRDREWGNLRFQLTLDPQSNAALQQMKEETLAPNTSELVRTAISSYFSLWQLSKRDVTVILDDGTELTLKELLGNIRNL